MIENTNFRGDRWDVTAPVGASIGPFNCTYGESLVGATVVCSVKKASTGELVQLTVTITNAAAGTFAVHGTPAQTRSIGAGKHSWALEITAGGITRQGWQGQCIITPEVAG